MKKKHFQKLRVIHGKIHNYIYKPVIPKSIEQTAEELSEKGYEKSLEKTEKPISEAAYPVDLVVTWVNPFDTQWREQKDRYFSELNNKEQLNNGQERYREWDLFKYWFRAVEKYAPWVRYVWLVTYGHLPDWLNVNHPKLKIIKHEDFIPSEYLPTFSTRSIELNLWRISELSERFIYFNDDMYLFGNVKKEDFFTVGLPNYCAITKPQIAYQKVSSHVYSVFNNLALYNYRFRIREVMEAHPEKWFSHLYGFERVYGEYTYIAGFLSGIYHAHLPLPLRKSSMEQCNKAFASEFRETCLNRFRCTQDINNQVFFMWEMYHNTFEPVSKDHYGFLYNISREDIDETKEKLLNTSDYKCICLNDNEYFDQKDFEYLKNQLSDLLNKKFDKKSLFEK